MKLIFIFLAASTFQGVARAHIPFRSFKTEFVLSARNLPNADPGKNGGPPDSYAVLSHSTGTFGSTFLTVAQTNVSKNDANPDWRELFRATVSGGLSRQRIQVAVFDFDPQNSDDFLGSTEFSLIDLVHFSKGKMYRTLLDKKGKSTGTLIVNAREFGSKDMNVDQRFFRPTKTIVFPKKN